MPDQRQHSEIEKFVHARLLEDELKENPFGVILAESSCGVTMNLTLTIADIIEAYLEKQLNTSL